MAEENIKDFTINWIITGLLITCLISFSIFFMLKNNPNGLNDGSSDIFNNTYYDMSGKLLESVDDANTILNITSNTNPEASDLGSRDSVASSYKMKGSSYSYWESSKIMFSWIFSGDIGKMLITVISGIITFSSIYYITKFIRNGI